VGWCTSSRPSTVDTVIIGVVLSFVVLTIGVVVFLADNVNAGLKERRPASAPRTLMTMPAKKADNQSSISGPNTGQVLAS
jgi:uncharacterized membrane protein